MTSESPTPERPRRTRSPRKTTEPASVGEEAVEQPVTVQPASAEATPVSAGSTASTAPPRQIFSSPATAARAPARIDDPQAPSIPADLPSMVVSVEATPSTTEVRPPGRAASRRGGRSRPAEPIDSTYNEDDQPDIVIPESSAPAARQTVSAASVDAPVEPPPEVLAGSGRGRPRRGGRRQPTAPEPEAAVTDATASEVTAPPETPPAGTPGSPIADGLPLTGEPGREQPEPLIASTDANAGPFRIARPPEGERLLPPPAPIAAATVFDSGAGVLASFPDVDTIELDVDETEDSDEESPADSDDIDDSDEGVDALPSARRRRRRGGRGRRGRGRGTNGDAVSEDPLAGEVAGAAESAAIVPAESSPPPMSVQPVSPAPTPVRRTTTPEPRRAPEFPAYAVDVEPLPPPTKRRPARRPGSYQEPRFSQAERDEIDRFVGVAPAQTPARGAPSPALEGLAASPLTPEEQAALAQAEPVKRSRRPRRRGEAEPQRDDGVTPPTPAFAVLPDAPAPTGTGGGGTIEALLVRQNVIIDTLMERQIALLRNIERSLIALERRLGSTAGGQANMPRAGVYVDVPNVVYAAERIGCNIDFGKLLAMLTRGRELVRATAYAPVSDDPQMRLETQKFVQPFVDRGYRIMTKPLKRFADGTMKGNFDVEMAMDILTMADRLDVVCLVSGDGDFSRLVEMVASKGVRVEVIAFSSSTSSELRAASDEYIDLSLRLKDICSGR